MKSVRFILVAVILSAFAGTALVSSLLQASEASVSSEGLAVGLFFSILSLGAAGIFFMGLKGFTVDSKRAYTYICAGGLMHAVGWSVAPIFFLIDPTLELGSAALVLASDLPYMIGTALILSGVWQFVRLLHIKTWVTNRKIVLPGVILVIVISWFVPHAALGGTSEPLYDVLHSVLWFECCLQLLATVMAWKLRHTISKLYSRSMTWLSLMITVNCIASTMYLITVLANLYVSTDPFLVGVQNAMGILYMVHFLLFVITSYSFARITRSNEKRENASIFDVITYTASLSAAPPEKIDPMLDPLREITASYKQGQALDAATLHRLAIIYKNLETFLIQNDPVRNFTPNEIRQRIAHRFSGPTYAPLFDTC